MSEETGSGPASSPRAAPVLPPDDGSARPPGGGYGAAHGYDATVLRSAGTGPNFGNELVDDGNDGVRGIRSAPATAEEVSAGTGGKP